MPDPRGAAGTLACEGDGWRMLPGSKLIYVRLEADGSVRMPKVLERYMGDLNKIPAPA